MYHAKCPACRTHIAHPVSVGSAEVKMRVDDAKKSALQARFEHGEKPRVKTEKKPMKTKEPKNTKSKAKRIAEKIFKSL